MKISRTGIALLFIALAAFFIGCNSLALGGDKKYKVDLQNLLMNMSDQISNEGKVSDQTFNKFENFMEKNKETYGLKGSYLKSEEILESLRTARAEPANAFHNYQQAKVDVTFVMDLLKTEVQD